MIAGERYLALAGQPSVSPKVLLLVVGGIIVIFLAARFGAFDGSEGNVRGRGEMFRCERCGRNYQPERVELMSSGDVRHFIDERCPGCGWDRNWGDPRKKPGGAGGSW